MIWSRRLDAAFTKNIPLLTTASQSTRRSRVGDPYGLASPFAKVSDFAKASSDKSEDKSKAELQSASFAVSPFRLTPPAVNL